ncbi:hypothetical protein LTR56_027392 [Elasticomyces elasticus]|nr:hypothetical protein LTR56_027392 [Elasticomyces elasticus]
MPPQLPRDKAPRINWFRCAPEIGAQEEWGLPPWKADWLRPAHIPLIAERSLATLASYVKDECISLRLRLETLQGSLELAVMAGNYLTDHGDQVSGLYWMATRVWDTQKRLFIQYYMRFAIQSTTQGNNTVVDELLASCKNLYKQMEKHQEIFKETDAGPNLGLDMHVMLQFWDVLATAVMRVNGVHGASSEEEWDNAIEKFDGLFENTTLQHFGVGIPRCTAFDLGNAELGYTVPYWEEEERGTVHGARRPPPLRIRLIGRYFRDAAIARAVTLVGAITVEWTLLATEIRRRHGGNLPKYTGVIEQFVPQAQMMEFTDMLGVLGPVKYSPSTGRTLEYRPGRKTMQSVDRCALCRHVYGDGSRAVKSEYEMVEVNETLDGYPCPCGELHATAKVAMACLAERARVRVRGGPTRAV